MSEQELLDSTEVTLEVTQSGKSELEVCQKIFGQLRKEIHGHVDGYLVEMHIKSFIFLDKKVEKKTKKFLFVFMPVEHETFIYTARIKAHVTILKPN